MLWPKRLLYLMYGCAAVIVGTRLGLPWWQTALLMAPLVPVDAVLRHLVSQRLAALERQLMAGIQSGADQQQLLALYRRQRLLRFAAPHHQLLGLLGLIYAASAQHAEAAVAYREALEDAPPAQAFVLAMGLADALFEIGQYEEAERTYRLYLDEEHRSARALANLSRIIRRDEAELEQAEEYLRLAVELERGGKLRCELVELLVEQGKLEDARWELNLAQEELQQGSAEELALLDGVRLSVKELESREQRTENEGTAGEAAEGEPEASDPS